MNAMNYEAWYEEDQLYNGRSKSEMIKEILDFVNGISHYSFDHITEEQIKRLDEKALNSVGIKIFIAKW